MDASDQALLKRFVADNEESAFEALVKRYTPMVMGVCRRIFSDSHDASDAFQVVFLVLSKKAASLRPKRSIGSWLYRVAVNTALTAKTRASHRAKYQEPLKEDMHEYPDQDINSKWPQIRPAIDEGLHRLPEKYRAPIALLLGWYEL